VIQVLNERNNEVIYTVRIKGNSFKPKVFEGGKYTVKLGEGEKRKTLSGLEASDADDRPAIKVKLE